MSLFDSIQKSKSMSKNECSKLWGRETECDRIIQKYEDFIRKQAKFMGGEKGRKLWATYKYNRLLHRTLQKEFVIGLMSEVKDENGKTAYFVYDYFICDKMIKQAGSFDRIKVIKISGDNFGEEFYLSTPITEHSSNFDVEVEVDVDCVYYGSTAFKVYIPDKCYMVEQLKEYADNQNEMRKKSYEKRCEMCQNDLNK